MVREVIGAVERRPGGGCSCCFVALLFPKEKREARAWSCFLVDLPATCGAGMLPSELRRAAMSDFDEPDFAKRSMAIREQATFLNGMAPGARLRSRDSMTEQTSLWLSLMSLPSCFNSSPW